MQEKILEYLKEANGYISGQELCERFGVSRTAVWKVINKLKEEGYDIDSVRNKGYYLKKESDHLSSIQLKKWIDTKELGQVVQYYAEIDSTNTKAKELASLGAAHGTVVTADHQTMGKGSRGRQWESPAGTGIFMSMILRPDIHPSRASMITLIAVYSIACVLQDHYGIDAKIKWPNDLVLNKKKIVGILTEMTAESEQVHAIITGIGVNVNMQDFPEELRDKATSLFMETGNYYDRAKLAADILNQFERDYQAFLENQDLSFLQEGYNNRLISMDQEVKILGSGRERKGIARGINVRGELILDREDGTREEIFSGEVSVRGLYRYV